MTESYLLEFGQRAIVVVLQLAGPILGFSLIIGVAISIFQAITQIQDMTLTFVPKILAVVIALVIFGPWMVRVIVNFTAAILTNLPNLVR